MPINENDLLFTDEPVQQAQSQQEGWGPWAGRQAVSSIEKLTERPFAENELAQSLSKITQPQSKYGAGLHQGINNLLGNLGVPKAEDAPTVKEFRRSSEQALGYKSGDFDPKGFIENVVQEAIPFGVETAVTAGAGAIPKAWKGILGAAVGGNTLDSIGQFFGLSDEMNAALHAGGALLGSFAGTRGKTIAAKDANYKKAEQLLSKKPTYNSPKGLKRSEEFLDKIHDLPGFNDIKEDANKFSRLFGNQGNVDVQKAWDFKKRLNELWPSAPRDIRKTFYEPMIETLNNDVLKPYGKINRRFGKAFQTAEQDFKALKGGIVTIDKIREYTPEVLRNLEAPKIPKWAKVGAKIVGWGALPTAGIWFDPVLTGGVAAIGLTGRQINRFANLMKQSPTAQKLAKDAVKNMAAGHIGNATRLFTQMGKELEKFDINEEDLLLG